MKSSVISPIRENLPNTPWFKNLGMATADIPDSKLNLYSSFMLAGQSRMHIHKTEIVPVANASFPNVMTLQDQAKLTLDRVKIRDVAFIGINLLSDQSQIDTNQTQIISRLASDQKGIAIIADYLNQIQSHSNDEAIPAVGLQTDMPIVLKSPSASGMYQPFNCHAGIVASCGDLIGEMFSNVRALVECE
jgi:hypothetical protein